jgi:antitoxin (DNA-binding transcriptional repressor) of toxin-antitoxin stability system
MSTSSAIKVYTEVAMAIGIREARETLPALVRRAARDGEEFSLGARGADEATLVGSRKYEEIRAEVKRLRARIRRMQARLEALEPDTRRNPFAQLQQALETGALAGGPEPARIRRYLPDYTATGETDRDVRIRTGGRGAEPEHRRDRPRA